MIDTLREQLRGRYVIEKALGRGGMGAVFLARDVQLDRLVALKVLPPEFVHQAALRERFLRETRTSASFSHPNIVPVFSIEERDDLLAFAMGYVEGESLAELVARAGPLSVRDGVRLLQDVGYALAYAHGRGVVHRDIKPDNIMIERATGRALVMDFGISRTISTANIAPGLTRVGEVVGTPEFMSPEQATGDEIDGRSDLYSLGLVAWFALSGELAISGENTQKVLARQLTEAVPSIGTRRADLPSALVDVVDRCVRKDPNERFAMAQELVEALDTAALRSAEVPLPIRLFADDARQSSLILLSSLLIAPLLWVFLNTTTRWDLQVVLPMVFFAAMVGGRLLHTTHIASRLTQRGFGFATVQLGFEAILAEREADRAQLRANQVVVVRRRRAVIVWICVFLLTYLIDAIVVAYLRREIRPGIHQVFRSGVLLLYLANALRGLSVVALLRSPFRRPPGEWLFRWFWLGAPGRWILRIASRGQTDSVDVSPSVALRAADASTPASAPAKLRDALAPSTPLNGASLEARVAALEQWRDQQTTHE